MSTENDDRKPPPDIIATTTGSSQENIDDEQLARDMQLALDLQQAEELGAHEERRNQHLNEHQIEQEMHGYYNVRSSETSMLFVPCKLNGKKMELLVDSGAGVSAMSTIMLAQLGLERKLNNNISGACGGVGSANIVGVVENLTCMIGHVEFKLYFMILDSPLPCVVLGLDQMRRLKCVIDLDQNLLFFGGKDGVSAKFLSPDKAKQAREKYELMNVYDPDTAVASALASVGDGGRVSAQASVAASAKSWVPSLFAKKR